MEGTHAVGTERDVDMEVRLAAFGFLNALRGPRLAPLRYSDLVAGFEFEGQRVPLLGPQGIFKPRVLREMPLSVQTAPEKAGKPRPYDDRPEDDGLWRYRYRGQDPSHPDNVGLRRAMDRHRPLIYFVGLVPGLYEAAYPVYVVRDNPTVLTFLLQVDDAQSIVVSSENVAEDESSWKRRYLTTTVQRRLHQASFRERVLRAYQTHCAVCRLRRNALLDAAHILPDHHPKGDPVVANGLALCKLHHAAFDCNVLGVRPDYKVEIREEILREIDGPMLEHGLQAAHGVQIRVPRSIADRPDPERLAVKYEEFKRAC
jgi:putative restriction endonuclease